VRASAASAAARAARKATVSFIMMNNQMFLALEVNMDIDGVKRIQKN
jgi:hypothetical protein